MAYFPFFMELSGRSGLIVGGGTVALRKVCALLPYGPQLTVVAPELHPELRQLAEVKLCQRAFRPEDLENRELVIAATDCPEENHRIAQLCQERRIPVNVVDDKAACSFLFPSLVKRGELSIGISTGGASPSAAIWLRNQISGLLPDHFGELLAWLSDQRETIRAVLPEESARAWLFEELFAICLSRGTPPEAAELAELVSRCQGKTQEEEAHGA
jgi:precorrin-2 dehydrogenase/sirohydrochlorin ferrochelatase